MANTIKHQGIVENINGSHLQVRIIQTSECASCSIKGHCSSADTKEKLIDVTDDNVSSYQPGDRVWARAILLLLHTILLIELINTSASLSCFLLACVERMALGADLNVDIFLC